MPGWDRLCATLLREPPAMLLAIVVGIAFVLAMALEGIHVSLMPKRFVRRHTVSQLTVSPPSLRADGGIVAPRRRQPVAGTAAAMPASRSPNPKKARFQPSRKNPGRRIGQSGRGAGS